MDPAIVKLAARMERELRGNILPFWLEHTIDRDQGGFHGALTNDRQIVPDAPRSLVLCARILWTFSSAYRRYGEQAYLAMAQHAYRYLVEKFYDPQSGGMYWWLDSSGQPLNDRKQTYGQAFAIYGLSEFFLASGALEAIDHARALFDLLEQHASDPQYGGYIEGCARDWSALADLRLSDKEPHCPKSMNTLLHVLEAYTNLLRAWPNQRVVRAQTALLDAFLQHVVDPGTHFTRLYFTYDWHPLSDEISYGHDIESSWLLVEAAQVLGSEPHLARASQAAVRMAEAVYRHGLGEDGSVLHAGSPRGVHDATRHWWCQAEGVVGFLNAYQISGEDRYRQAALRIWEFIDSRMVDRQHGEWFKILDPAGNPLPGQVKTGPWEDPYHHARACLEVIQRAGEQRG